MTKARRVLGLGVLVLGVGALPASAQTRSWNVCGGSNLYTCASVGLAISGQNVTLRLWNLSGFYNSSYGTIFSALGFDFVGTAQAVEGSLTMSGPTRGADAPLPWMLSNYGVGNLQLDMVTASGTGPDNGIANECSTLPGPPPRLWVNPCALPSGDADPGWITLSFDITGEWNLESTTLNIHGINERGVQTDCITGGPGANCSVVSEPITIALLGTGLLGIGGAGALRRRRRDGDIESV